jgi:hypothetical protein
MTGVVPVFRQILFVTVGLALIGGVAGALIGKFAASASLTASAGAGMIITGVIVGYLAANTGSTTRVGMLGAFSGPSSVPRDGYQYVAGALLTFGLGIVLLVVA